MHFPLVINNKANIHLSELLASLNISEKKQVEQLLLEIRNETEQTERLRNRVAELERENGKQVVLVDRLRKELHEAKRDGDVLRKKNVDAGRQIEEMERALLEREAVRARLEVEVERYERQVLELERYR